MKLSAYFSLNHSLASLWSLKKGSFGLSGDLIEVSVTAGISSDGGLTLDEAEPTMFFRNEDFTVVSSIIFFNSSS